MPVRIDVGVETAFPPSFIEIQESPRSWVNALPVHCKDGGIADKLFGQDDPIVMCAYGEPDEGKVMWVHTSSDDDDCYWICVQGYKIEWFGYSSSDTTASSIVKWLQFTKSELHQHLKAHEYPCGFNNLVYKAMYHA